MKTNLPKRSSSISNNILKSLIICFFLISTVFSFESEAQSKRHLKQITPHTKKVVTSSKVGVHKRIPKTIPKVQPKHIPKTIPKSVVPKQEPFTHLVGYIKNKYKRSDQSAKQITTSLMQASKKFGIDRYVLAAIAAKESSFKPKANHSGNVGLMQIHASVNGKAIKKENVTSITNVHSNIMVGSRLLRECLDSEAHGNMSHALSLYNRGCSADKHVPRKIRAGHGYAKRVLKESQLARNWTNPLL
jgi:hypothetical protein